MEKKKELADLCNSIHKTKGKPRTKHYDRYLQTFGVQSTITHLSEVSNYSMDEIWLFTSESFAMEVKKYDMKISAESKEMEAQQKEIEAKYGN